MGKGPGPDTGQANYVCELLDEQVRRWTCNGTHKGKVHKDHHVCLRSPLDSVQRSGIIRGLYQTYLQLPPNEYGLLNSPLLANLCHHGEQAFCQLSLAKGKARVGQSIWEGFKEEDAPASGAEFRQDPRTFQWLAVSSQSLNLSASFFKKGEGQQAEREEKEKNKTPGRQFTFDLRQGKYLLTHSGAWL